MSRTEDEADRIPAGLASPPDEAAKDVGGTEKTRPLERAGLHLLAKSVFRSFNTAM